MDRVSHKKHQQEQQVAHKQRAVEPEQKFCFILARKVTVLVDYPEYSSLRNKGPRGDVYCENIVNCYRQGVHCRYSGISPLFRDPFAALDEREYKMLEEAQKEKQTCGTRPT